MSQRRVLVLGLILSVSPCFAMDVNHGRSPVAGANQSAPISSNISAEDAKVIAEALTAEMGDSCVAGPGESPRIKVSLANVKSISDSMIAQFTKLVEDEIAEKRGPLKIGPPDIMDQMLQSPASIRGFAAYHGLVTRVERGADQNLRKQKRKNFEARVSAMYAGREDISPDTLLKVAEASRGIADILGKPLDYPTRASGPPTRRSYLGMKYYPETKKYFSSLEEVAPALPAMNEFLTAEAEGLKRDTAMVNALADGLALSMPTALITVAKGTVASLTARRALQAVPVAGRATAAAATGGTGQAAAAVPFQVLLLTTMVQTVGNDLRATLTGIGNAEVRNKTKEAIGVIPGASPATSGASAPVPVVEGELAQTAISDAVIASLPRSEGSGAGRISVPVVNNPQKFTDSIIAMREASTAYLRKPELLRHSAVGAQATASSALNSSLQTIVDTRTSNDALMLNMQSFYNTSRRARADYVALAEQAALSRTSTVKREDIEKLSSTLDSDINLMLEKMDDTASLLSNQSENFTRGIAAIETACDEDAKKIFNSWGKYQRVFRDRLGTSPFEGPVSPAKAYLSDAILSRADCVTKKSIARRMEMMRLGTVLTQFKSSCQDIKSWSAAGKAYRTTREMLMRETRSSSTRAQPALPDVTTGAPQP